MGFVKTASVQSLATAALFEDGLRKVAASDDLPSTPKSYYLDGARKIDVRGMLKAASSKYDISADPADYIFEAIRANSTNVPNENHDAFHKSELLRFDTRKAMPVYMTYVGKPHHLQHRASNPLRARGVILDSHYNDDAPALAECPTCTHKTASEDERDPSGIHCRKCGSVVKDEFVEILVAVDGKKDPRLVREIQAGALNAGSMGCNCSSTACNVCSHTARTTSDFCEHIRGSAKGSLWLRQGQKFVRTTPDKVKAALKSAGMKPPTDGHLVAISLVIPERDFEVRKAFEFCQGVEFDEYSRVHKPADPKARTVEILKAASAADQLSLPIDQETEQLIRRARLAQLEANMPKAASRQENFFAVRVNGNDEDIHVGTSLSEAVKLAEVGKRDAVEYFELSAPSQTAALTRAVKASIERTAQYLPMEADVNLVVPDGVKVHLDQNGQAQMSGQPGATPGAPGAPGAMPGAPQGPGSIEDVTKQEVSPEEPQQSPEEFGMLPPGASMGEGSEAMDMHADEEMDGEAKEHEMAEQKYASVYGDFEVEVTEKGATVHAPGGEVFSVKSASILSTDDQKRRFGGSIIDSVQSDGLVRTALKFKGAFNSRVADAVEGAMFDMAGGRPLAPGGSLEGHMEPMKDKRKEPKDVVTSPGATEDYDDDMKDSRPFPANSIESRDTNMADEAEVASPKEDSLKGHMEPQKETRPEYSKNEDALGGAMTNMKANAGGSSKSAAAPSVDPKVAEERLRKLYASRFEKAKAEMAAEVETVKTTERQKIFRALRLAQKRAALNLESSPLKATVLDSLTVSRPIGRSASTGMPLEYQGLDEGLALHLVEAAWADSSAEEVESLIERTAELLTYDDKYLVSAEKDLSKQAARVPQVSDEGQIQPVNEIQRRAASMREAALSGNLHLSPAMTDSGASEEKANVIRSALGPTKVSRLLEGAPEEFRLSN